jgi:hypothetical protein
VLEVTLLKVRHGSEQEAKKLLPYIRSCDVYSPEESGLKAQDVKKILEWWKGIRSLPRSRALIAIAKVKSDLSEIDEYSLKQRDYLFRSQKPLVYLERWSEEEGNTLQNRTNTYIRGPPYAIKALAEGDINEYFRLYLHCLEEMCAVTKARDMHIGQNLSHAEGWIRQENPQLKGKDPLRLTFELGFGHWPEKYSQIPVNVIHLADTNPLNVNEELSLKVGNAQKPSDLSSRDILAYGLSELSKIGMLTISQDELKSASFNELERIFRLRRT